MKIELQKWLNNLLNEVEKPSPQIQQGFYFKFHRNLAYILLKWEDILYPKFI